MYITIISFKCNITLRYSVDFLRLNCDCGCEGWRTLSCKMLLRGEMTDEEQELHSRYRVTIIHLDVAKWPHVPDTASYWVGISRQMLPPADAEHCLATPRWPACFNFLSSRVQKLRGLFGWGLEPDHWTKIFTGIFLEDVTLLWHKWSQTFIQNKSSGNNFKLKATFPTSFKQ